MRKRKYLLVLLIGGCVRAQFQDAPVDRAFCAISEQRGKSVPTLAEVESIVGRYAVNLYSVDSAKVLGSLDITLFPTDTLHRYYQLTYDGQGGSRWVRREVPLLANGDERHLSRNKNRGREPVNLYYTDAPHMSVFAPPTCKAIGADSQARPIYACESIGVGLILNIKQVKPYGFAGTVSQVGVGTSMQAPGKPLEYLGPHFFCAIKTR